MQGTTLVRWSCAAIFSLMLLLPVSQAAAEERVPPRGQETTCADVLAGAGAHEKGFELATDPSDGSEVRPGGGVEVRMTWMAADFTDAPLYHALACVTVDGDLSESLSRIEPNAENDGEFTHSFTVPDGLPAGSEICTRGAIAGDGNGYFELNKTRQACFGVVQDEQQQQSPPPAADFAADLPAEVPPPAPAVQPPTATVAPPASDTTAPQPAEVQGITDERPPTEVLGISEERPSAVNVAPATPTSPAPAPATLARTGRPDRELLVWAGLLLALGGGAITGTTRKTSVGRSGGLKRWA